mgnify:CR=1 FL=1
MYFYFKRVSSTLFDTLLIPSYNLKLFNTLPLKIDEV